MDGWCSDLKPENLLYSDPTPEAVLKLADFGLAKLMGPNVLMHTACGSVSQPEQQQQQQARGAVESGALDGQQLTTMPRTVGDGDGDTDTGPPATWPPRS